MRTGRDAAGRTAAYAAIEAAAAGGTAVVRLTEKAVAELAGKLAEIGADEVVLEISAPGAERVVVTAPASAMAGLADKTGVDLTIVSPVARIAIPNALFAGLPRDAGDMEISAGKTADGGVRIALTACGEALDLSAGVCVTVPAAYNTDDIVGVYLITEDGAVREAEDWEMAAESGLTLEITANGSIYIDAK